MALQIRNDLLDLFSNTNINLSLAELFTPEEALKSSDKSFLFIKQVISISVSTLLYLRNGLREVVFHTFLCDGNLSVYLLSPTLSEENRVALWAIKGLLEVFDVIKMKYVKKFTMFIAFKNEGGKPIVELYSFNLEYKDGIKISFAKNDTEIKPISSGDVAKLLGNTRGLMRSIMVLCNSHEDKIPENADIRIRFRIYYNGTQPNGFSIPGWTPAYDEPMGILKETMVLGNVSTDNHHIQMEHKAYEGECNFFKRLFNWI